MIPTTREKILEYLKVHRVASASELNHALHVTIQDIRHHLEGLLEEGLIEPCGQRPPNGKGRPTNLFCLCENIKRNNYAQLSGALLNELLAGLPAEEQESKLLGLARQMAPAETEIVKNLTQRLNRAIRRLDEMAYQPRWEARATGPQIFLGHCPYAALLSSHPELCRLDVHLIAGLLEAPVRQLTRLNGDQVLSCAFSVEILRR